MALTTLSPSEDAMAGVRFARLTPEVHVEETRSVVALRGEADASTRGALRETEEPVQR